MITQEVDRSENAPLHSPSVLLQTTRRSEPRRSLQPQLFKKRFHTVRIRNAEGFENYVWQNRAVLILLWVMRFMKQITHQTFAQSFKMMSKRMFTMIGDKAADFSYYMMKDYFKYYKPQALTRLQYNINKTYIQKLEQYKLFRYFMTKSIIFKPESHFLLIWNFYIIVIINIAVFYISAKFAFSLDYRISEYHLLRHNLCYVLPFFSFIVDLIFKFFICYYEKGQLIRERKKIIINYIKTSFFLDIIVILSQVLYLYADIKNLDLFILVKILQIPTLSGNLLDRLELTSKHLAIYDLIRLFYLILIGAHFCSCGWFYIGTSEHENTWVVTYGLVGKDWIEQYLNTFYWSIITMSTIGYGDIVPQNLHERVFLIFIALISCCTFGYSIGSIGQIFGQLSAKSNQIRIDMNGLKKYLRIKGYNPELQIKIRRYFEYVWNDQSDEDSFNLQIFYRQLPQQLQNEMVIDLHMRSISQIPFLTQNFPENFLKELAAKLTEEKYGAAQTIYEQGSSSDYIYILCEGGVEFYHQLPDNTLVSFKEILGKDNIFGHIDFLFDRNNSSSCRSTISARVLKISRDDFQDIAVKNCYEQICQLKDQLKFSGRLDCLHIKCEGCSKRTHEQDECPMVTGFPNRSKVLLQYKKWKANDREYRKRTNHLRRVNTLRNEMDVSDSVIFYLLNDKNNLRQIEQKFKLTDIKTDDQISIISKKRRFTFKQMKSNIPEIKQQLKRNQSLRQDWNLSEGIIAKYMMSMNEISEKEQKQIVEDVSKQMQMQSIEQINTEKPNYAEILVYSKENSPIIQDSISQSNSQDQSDLSIVMRNIKKLYDTDQTTNDVNLFNSWQESMFQNQIGLSMGTHKDIFEQFDKLMDYDYYMPHMNLRTLLEKDDINRQQATFNSFLERNVIFKKRARQSKYILNWTLQRRDNEQNTT